MAAVSSGENPRHCGRSYITKSYGCLQRLLAALTESTEVEMNDKHDGAESGGSGCLPLAVLGIDQGGSACLGNWLGASQVTPALIVIAAACQSSGQCWQH